MQKIEYEKRAVAFIDVLGFKSLVEASVNHREKLADLQELVNLLDSALPKLEKFTDPKIPQHLHPIQLYISDCIILSAPLKAKKRDKVHGYNGLATIVMRAIQITQQLMGKGYLVRGGISCGDVWHKQSNIIGPAYQEAYQLETTTNMPRIELTDSAKREWERDNFYKQTSMCISYDGRFMVNGLCTKYFPTDCAYENILEKYRKAAVYQIQLLSNNGLQNSNNRKKWLWHLKYIDDIKKAP